MLSLGRQRLGHAVYSNVRQDSTRDTKARKVSVSISPLHSTYLLLTQADSINTLTSCKWKKKKTYEEELLLTTYRYCFLKSIKAPSSSYGIFNYILSMYFYIILTSPIIIHNLGSLRHYPISEFRVISKAWITHKAGTVHVLHAHTRTICWSDWNR